MSSKYIDVSEPFLSLQQKIERDLAATGFAPKVTPPFEEPDLPTRLSMMTETDLKDAYDNLLRFYGYLCDQIGRYEPYLVTTKKRLEAVTGVATLEVSKDKQYTNAGQRDAAVNTNEVVLQAVTDHLYFKQMSGAQEERRKKLSKYIDRVYRELSFRYGYDKFKSNQQGQGYSNKEESRKAKLSRMFIKRDDE